METPRPNTNRHGHARKCLHCVGIEPASSCILGEYSHYAKLAVTTTRLVSADTNTLALLRAFHNLLLRQDIKLFHSLPKFALVTNTIFAISKTIPCRSSWRVTKAEKTRPVLRSLQIVRVFDCMTRISKKNRAIDESHHVLATANFMST
jgi:hypothetical protein